MKLTDAKRRKLRQTPATDGIQNKLQIAMDLAGMRQEDVAEAIGVEQGYISRLLRGERGQRIPLETTRRFARLFGCSVDELFPEPDDERISA